MDLESCIYNYDFNVGDIAARSDNLLTNVVINSVEYITTPISLGPPNVISIGPYMYNTNFVDALNDLNIENFIAEYPSEGDMDLVAALPPGGVYAPNAVNCFRLTTEVGSTFTIKVAEQLYNGDFTITDSTINCGGPFCLPYPDAPWLFLKIGCETG